MTIIDKAADNILNIQREYDRLTIVHDVVSEARWETSDEDLYTVLETCENALLEKLSDLEHEARIELKRRK